VPPLTSPPLAEQIYGLTAADDPQVVGGMTQPVDKEGAPTAGITSTTGITSYDLVGYHKNDDEDEQSATLPDPTIIKGDEAAELAAFRRYAKQRRRLERPWRDFDFRVVDRATAAKLNGGAQAAIRKTATWTPGLTKRSGMISLDLPGGTIDPVPGGVTDHHITVVYLGKDLDDDAFANARERAKAAAQAVPGPLTGVIGGIDTFEASAGSDDKTPAFAPVVLPGVEKLRAALEDLSASEHRDYHPHVTLAYLDEGDPLPDPVPGTPVTFTHLTVHRGTEAVSYPLGPPLTKAANSDPKAGAGKPANQWPGWKLDLAAAHYWAPRITATLTEALTAAQTTQLARDYPASGTSPQDGDDQDATALTAAALAWLTAQQIDLETPLSVTLDDLHTDGYLIGVICAHAVIDGADPDRGGWAHGDTDAAEAQIAGLGAIAGLDALRDETASRAQAMAQTRREHIARALALGAAGAEDPESIGDAMHDALIGGAIGVTIAITEITFASGLGALFGYGQRGVAMGQWVIDPRSKVCPRCLANAAAGPVPIGQPYPSGDTAAPIHPRCACAVLPA
jgi:hypothetical protein